MNKKILYSIIGLVLVGGLFSAVYAGSIINTITFEGLTIFKENAQFDKDVNIDGIVTGQAITDFQNQIDNNEARITDIELFLEERSDFWEFLEESGEEFFESQIYEVSGVSVIQSGTSAGSLVQLRCLEGDTFIDGERNIVLSFESPVSFPVQRSDFIQVSESVSDIDGNSARVIGADVRARQDGGIPTFDVPVTITGLCLSPSS